MFATKLVHNLGRENPRGKGSSEDGIELCVQTSDPHLGEVPVRIDDLGSLHLAFEGQLLHKPPIA